MSITRRQDGVRRSLRACFLQRPRSPRDLHPNSMFCTFYLKICINIEQCSDVICMAPKWWIRGGGVPPSEVVFCFVCLSVYENPADLDPNPPPPSKNSGPEPPPPLEEFLDLPLMGCMGVVIEVALLFQKSVTSSGSGVLNRGEISPMGELLGIQGGNESV